MKTDAVFTRPIRAEETFRQIILRTHGHSHGRVTRLVSPGDIGERIKPFVFLDYFDADPARVIAGEYDGVKSIVETPLGITYLDVRLKAGERWSFHPAKGHDVAWIASHQGIVTTPEQVSMGEVAVFEEGDQ